MALPAEMRALVGGDFGQYRLVDDSPVPTPRPGTVLVEVHAVALNPADAKMTDYSVTAGAIGGNDFAGTVCAVGPGVTRFRKGDRVLAMAFGLNPSDSATGAFGQYALATEDLACRVPEGVSFEEAATMGVAIGTAGTALFQALQLPLPGQGGKDVAGVPVLVSGGATATGTMAIQLLKCAGLTPVVTCSPANNALCQSLGAAACFDYHSPTCGADIRMHTNNGLAHVLDCVTDAATMKMCYEAIGSSGGAYVALDPFATAVQYTRRDVQATWLMIYSLFGEAVNLAGVYGRPPTRQDREFAARLFPLVEGLLERGLIKNHPIDVRQGGLGGLTEGIEELRLGMVRAKKLVYPVV